jgi:hypothetical protein
MEDLSLHILDVVENSTAAGATLIEIRIRLDSQRDLLEIRIKDNGRGMDTRMAQAATDPFVTTRTTRRVGLGLPFLKQATEEAGGTFAIHSALGRGTEIVASFKAGHIDRKPLGDIAATMVALILGNPDIDFLYEGDFDGITASLDTRETKEQLGEVPITDPAVLSLIQELLSGGAERADLAIADGGEHNG